MEKRERNTEKNSDRICALFLGGLLIIFIISVLIESAGKGYSFGFGGTLTALITLLVLYELIFIAIHKFINKRMEPSLKRRFVRTVSEWIFTIAVMAGIYCIIKHGGSMLSIILKEAINDIEFIPLKSSATRAGGFMILMIIQPGLYHMLASSVEEAFLGEKAYSNKHPMLYGFVSGIVLIALSLFIWTRF